MKILFVTSEHPSLAVSGVGTFSRDYVACLRSYAEVVCVYFHYKSGKTPLPDQTVDYVFSPSHIFEAFSPEARILESAASLRAQVDSVIREFKPDVIHCNDRNTFLPFRFDKNVFYSSHLIFENLRDNAAMNDLYFQEMKMERCALEGSAILAVYSDFAAKSAYSLAGGLCAPIVLPLGVDFEKFNSRPQSDNLSAERSVREAGADTPRTSKKKHADCLLVAENTAPRYACGARKNNSRARVLRVCYFGRIENVRKGVNDFVYAVNRLGISFKRRHNIEYAIFGDGKIDVGLDTSLFDRIKCLTGDALIEAYQTADIVVLPSRYEPFGFTGLEAMAAGSLVLLPKGLGMDMYAIPGWNCLEIPHSIEGITQIIEDAVLNFEVYKVIRDNAVRTAMKWSWERSVAAHIYIYRLMSKGRIGKIYSAYSMNEREIIHAYTCSSEIEKSVCASYEKRGAQSAIDFIRVKNENSDCKILVLTGVYSSADDKTLNNVQIFSVLNEEKYGLVVRPECLPFDDGEFDVVIACGAWETILDPCDALLEMQRVCTDEAVVLYYKGKAHKWQTFQMESIDDWSVIAPKNVEIEINSELSKHIESVAPYSAVIFHRA